jgi:hypothetical protein
MAQVHAALWNKNGALDLIEEACLQRDWPLHGLKQDSRFDSVRTDPRFRRVVRRVAI